MTGTITRRDFVLLMAVTLGGMSGCLSGCAAHASGRAKELASALAAGSDDVRSFADDANRETALPAEVRRIVPSGPYAQVLLSTLCPDYLIGLSSGFSAKQSDYFPSRLTDLPVLGRYYGKNATMNYEAVIELAPDVIVDIGESSKDIGAAMDDLQEQSGIPCIFLKGEFGHLPSTYRALGDLTGLQERAEKLARYIEEACSFAQDHRQQIVDRDIKLMYATGAHGYQVKAKGTVHSTAIDLLGFNNVAVLDEANSTEVSPEQVMIWQPDVLLLSQESGFYSYIYDDATWSAVSAVRNRRVYEVPYEPYEWLDRPPSVQTVLGLQWLGNLLCPDIYDFDMVQRAQEFFKLFWDYDLSDADARVFLSRSTLLPE